MFLAFTLAVASLAIVVMVPLGSAWN